MSVSPIRKAVFPVAGMGTRFLPATKTIPKEMLPILDRPIIQYAVDEAVQAGCDTLIFVTGRSKRAVEDYFDRNPELENELEAKGKVEALEAVRNIIPPHVKVIFVRQPTALGLGHAVLCASPLISPDERFAVLLPDDLIDGGVEGVLSQMINAAGDENVSVIATEKVATENVHKYGIVGTDNPRADLFRLTEIVEKPKAEDAPSNLAVVGRYVLHGSIMQLLETQTPGTGGEIQLTDAIAKLVKTSTVYGYRFDGRRFDCGSKKGFLEANIHYGLTDN